MRTKYDQETKDRVIRMFYGRREEVPEEFPRASYRRLLVLTGIPIDTMRGWVGAAGWIGRASMRGRSRA